MSRQLLGGQCVGRLKWWQILVEPQVANVERWRSGVVRRRGWRRWWWRLATSARNPARGHVAAVVGLAEVAALRRVGRGVARLTFGTVLPRLTAGASLSTSSATLSGIILCPTRSLGQAETLLVAQISRECGRVARCVGVRWRPHATRKKF